MSWPRATPEYARRAAPGVLRKPRRAALVVIAALVATASLVSFAESYRGLYAWSSEHGLHGSWAVIWPLQVDVFIAVGELALFVGLVDRWARRDRAGAWAVTIAGLAVSVAGNVGHVTGHALTNRVTAAVPPVAAASALAVGLGVLKRVVAAAVPPGDASSEPSGSLPEPGPRTALMAPETGHAFGPRTDRAKAARRPALRATRRAAQRATETYRASVAAGVPLSDRALAREHKISRRRAAAIRAAVGAESNGHHPAGPPGTATSG